MKNTDTSQQLRYELAKTLEISTDVDLEAKNTDAQQIQEYQLLRGFQAFIAQLSPYFSLLKVNNLSDIEDIDEAKNNLGVSNIGVTFQETVNNSVAVPISNTNPTNVMSVVVPSGKYMVTTNVTLGADNVTLTQAAVGISTQSATMPTETERIAYFSARWSSYTGETTISSTEVITLNSETTLYSVLLAPYTTMGIGLFGYGRITAIRISA